MCSGETHGSLVPPPAPLHPLPSPTDVFPVYVRFAPRRRLADGVENWKAASLRGISFFSMKLRGKWENLPRLTCPSSWIERTGSREPLLSRARAAPACTWLRNVSRVPIGGQMFPRIYQRFSDRTTRNLALHFNIGVQPIRLLADRWSMNNDCVITPRAENCRYRKETINGTNNAARVPHCRDLRYNGGDIARWRETYCP